MEKKERRGQKEGNREEKWKQGEKRRRDYQQIHTFRGDGYVHKLDCGDNFTAARICQNVSNLHNLKYMQLLYVYIDKAVKNKSGKFM